MNKVTRLIQECKSHGCKPGCEHLRELVLCTGPEELELVVKEYLCAAPEEIVEDLSWNLLQTGLHLGDDDDDAHGLETFRSLVSVLCSTCDPTPLFFSVAEAISDPGVSTEKKGCLMSTLPQMLGRVPSEKRRQSHLISCLGFVRTVLDQCREEASNDNEEDDADGNGDENESFRAIEYSDIAGGGRSGLNKPVMDGTAAFIRGLSEMVASDSRLQLDVAAVATSTLLEAICETAGDFGRGAARSVVLALKENACCGVEYILALIMSAKRARIREERVMAFKSRFHPDENDDDDDEGNDSENENDGTTIPPSLFKHSEIGLGAWLHALVFASQEEEDRFPGVADRVWAYKAVLTVVVPMLEVPCIKTNLMAWDLLRAAVMSVRKWWGLDTPATSIPPAQLAAMHVRGLSARDVDAAALTTLAPAMLGNVVHLSDPAARDRGTALLQGFWGTLRPALRFDVLGRLLDNVSVELIPHVVRQVKREIVHGWPNSSIRDRCRDGGSDADDADPESRKEAEACFCGNRVVELFQRMMNARGRVFGQLRERFAACSDAALDVLNLYRFVLLRDRTTNYTGLLNKSQIGEANRVALNPVRLCVAECIREYGGYCSSEEAARRKIESFALMGLPQISLKDFRDAASRHLLKAYLIEDVLKRIEEITSSLD